jgi:predicted ATP-grasp superfamily ATP-dependent carboligase
VDTPAQLRGLWDRLAAAGLEVVAQELVPGPETSVESYHVYVDRSGAIVAEFTGQKLRTRPTSFGQSTTVQITQRADVATLGREVTRRLELLGVAKIDFKRDLQGKLHLLEVNPRFNLWHYPGALAGVNLPALAYADLAGRPRPHIRPVRPGVRWCSPREDLPAARAAGVSLPDWILHSLVPSEARGMLAWDDPLPFLIAAARLLRSELGSRVGRANMARASGGRGGH